MADKPDTVDAKNSAYEVMADYWELIQDLLGGTKAMRAAEDKWLPREPAETMGLYALRLRRSYLYNAYRDTVRRLASKPFSKPVTLQGTLPDRLSAIEEDVDRTGRDLTQFARDVFTACVNYGLTHILVDYSRVPKGASVADEKSLSARPTFVHVPPPQLYGWRVRREEGLGTPALSQVRIYEQRVEDVGNYLDKTVEIIRVYTETTWELWRKEPGEEEYVLFDEGDHTFGRVPLLTCYTNKLGYMTGLPPLEDLAWLNLAHWQSMSDQRSLLRLARVGILFAAGFTAEEMEKPIVVGPTRTVRSSNPDAKLEYVEHTGSAIGLGEEDLRRLEERMEVLGLQPLIQRTGGITATARALDESRTQTDVQMWIRSVEQVLLQCYKLAAEWAKVKLPGDFKVDIFSDFGITTKVVDDVKALIQMRARGDITHETFLREVKRRGLLTDTLDVDEEIAATQNEGPALALVGVPEEEEEEEEMEEE